MRHTSVVFTLLVALLAIPIAASGQRAPQMHPPVSLHDPVISSDGGWLAAEERLDRNNGSVRVRSTDGAVTYTIPRGQNPRISRNSRWVSAMQSPPIAESDSDDSSSTRAGQTLVLLDTKDGSQKTFEFVMSYDVTYTSSYLIYLQSLETEVEKKNHDRKTGTLHVVHLSGDKVLTVENVTHYVPHLTHANHETNDHYAYVVHDEETERDTLYMALVNPGPDNLGNFGMRGIHTGHRIAGLRWALDSATAVFLDQEDKTGMDGRPYVKSVLYTWHDNPGRSGQREFARVNTSK